MELFFEGLVMVAKAIAYVLLEAAPELLLLPFQGIINSRIKKVIEDKSEEFSSLKNRDLKYMIKKDKRVALNQYVDKVRQYRADAPENLKKDYAATLANETPLIFSSKTAFNDAANVIYEWKSDEDFIFVGNVVRGVTDEGISPHLIIAVQSKGDRSVGYAVPYDKPLSL